MNSSRLSDLNDKQMQEALDGWTRNPEFHGVVDAMLP